MNPLIYIGDPNLNDRKLLVLMLNELISAKAEIRALSNLLLMVHKNAVSPDQLNAMTDKAQDAALAEMQERVVDFQKMTNPTDN